MPEPCTVCLWPVPCWQLGSYVRLGSTKDLQQCIRVSGHCGSVFLVGTNKGRKRKQRSSFFAKNKRSIVRMDLIRSSFFANKIIVRMNLHSWTDAWAPKKKSQVQAKHPDLTANAFWRKAGGARRQQHQQHQWRWWAQGRVHFFYKNYVVSYFYVYAESNKCFFQWCMKGQMGHVNHET